MTQHGLDYYMNEKEKVGLNSEIENDLKETGEQIIDSNGIVEVKYGNEIYRAWKVEFIRPFVIKYLKERYPLSIIVRELNNIDLTLFDNKSDEIIPIEIEKSIIKYETKVSNITFAHKHFENAIRTQIEDNIHNYSLCWFFFDTEYHRLLQSGNLGKTTSINMTWIIDLMEKNILKVFTIKYDGSVKELTIKDFDFLKNLSQIYQIGHDNDKRILNRNKLKIYRNVVNGYNFTQNEIDNFYKEFDNHYSKDKKIDSKNFFMKYGNERCKLYGHLFQAIGTLQTINNCMDMNSNSTDDRYFATHLGIFEVVGNYARGPHGHHMKFVDKFDICKYFPGYLRQEKHWLTYKECKMDGRMFSDMCRGRYKNAKTMFDY